MTFSLPCLGMTRALRVRQTYDHRLRDAIAATGSGPVPEHCEPGVEPFDEGVLGGLARLDVVLGDALLVTPVDEDLAKTLRCIKLQPK